MFKNRVSCNLWDKAFLYATQMPSNALANGVGVAKIVAPISWTNACVVCLYVVHTTGNANDLEMQKQHIVCVKKKQ